MTISRYPLTLACQAFTLAATLKHHWLVSVAAVVMLAVHSPFSLADNSTKSTRSVASASAPAAIGPYVQAVRAGGALYLSGQLPIDPATGALAADGSIEGQTRQVLANLKAILAADGLTLGDVVSTTVYLQDLNDFAQVNAVYATEFSQSPPARATVQVAALPKNARLEISAIAQRH